MRGDGESPWSHWVVFLCCAHRPGLVLIPVSTYHGLSTPSPSPSRRPAPVALLSTCSCSGSRLLLRAHRHIVTHPKLLLACASKAEAQHCHVHSAKLLLNLPWLRGSLGDTRERTCSHEAQAFLPSRPICPESERLRHTPKKARQEVLGSCCRHAHYRYKYRLWRSALTRASALFRRDACSVWTQPLGPHRACCALLGRWGADLHARVGKSVSDARS
jgi:hypothetical protein